MVTAECASYKCSYIRHPKLYCEGILILNINGFIGLFHQQHSDISHFCHSAMENPSFNPSYNIIVFIESRFPHRNMYHHNYSQ